MSVEWTPAEFGLLIFDEDGDGAVGDSACNGLMDTCMSKTVAAHQGSSLAVGI